jgi:hypothetical protein
MTIEIVLFSKQWLKKIMNDHQKILVTNLATKNQATKKFQSPKKCHCLT